MNPVDFLKPASVKEMIRLGNKYEGGYVVYSRLLTETDILISYGVGWDTAFEEHFHLLTGEGVFLFDPTMFRGRFLIDFRYLLKLAARFELRITLSYMLKVIKWWRRRKKLRIKGLYFIKEGIAPEKKIHFNTLANHIKRYNLEGRNILLKIDIEGDEYAVFENEPVFAALKNINQIVIEWHDLKTRLRELKSILAQLKSEFEIVHVHGNNWGTTFKLYSFCNDEMKDVLLPDVLEMTLVKRSHIFPEDILTEPIIYPIKNLDYPNDPDKADYLLDFVKTFNFKVNNY